MKCHTIPIAALIVAASTPTIAGMALPPTADEGARVYWSSDQEEDVTSVQISPTSTFVATGGYGGDASARLWNARDGLLLDEFPGHEHGVVTVSISGDERLLAVGHILVDFYHGVARTNVYDIETRELRHQFGGTYAEFSAGSNRIACGGGLFNRYVGVYELPSGIETAEIYTGDYVWDMALAPDGKTVATCAGKPEVVLWDAESGQEIGRLVGHEGGVGTLAFSADGTMIATGVSEQYADARIKVWLVADGTLLQNMSGHSTGVINALTFSPRGDTLLSCGRDVPVGGEHSVRLWRVSDGAELALYPFPHQSFGVLSADYAANGAGAIVGLGNGRIIAAGAR